MPKPWISPSVGAMVAGQPCQMDPALPLLLREPVAYGDKGVSQGQLNLSCPSRHGMMHSLRYGPHATVVSTLF